MSAAFRHGIREDNFKKKVWFNQYSLGILAHLLRMVSWNLNTMRFEGDWTPQSSSENMTGCLGTVNFYFFLCFFIQFGDIIGVCSNYRSGTFSGFTFFFMLFPHLQQRMVLWTWGPWSLGAIPISPSQTIRISRGNQTNQRLKVQLEPLDPGNPCFFFFFFDFFFGDICSEIPKDCGRPPCLDHALNLKKLIKHAFVREI